MLVRVESSALTVRAQPSAASAVVGYMKRGETTVATLGSHDGWLLVRTRDGRTGYVAARFVELVRVIAVEGEPVPSRPAGSERAGPCGPGAGPVELDIRDARIECADRVLGEGVEGCEIRFDLEARAPCPERIYRALECEIGVAWRVDEDDRERTASASARTVMVIDGGTAADRVTVSWKAPDAETVRAVRLAAGSCALR